MPRRQLLIQIDGLSKPVLDRAIADGTVGALADLARQDDSTLTAVFPGLPSTTPAAQGELFYGVRSGVPAFAYLHDRRQARHMLDPSAAFDVQEALEERGEGLLSGGSSYCNIYTGGARVFRFCPAGLARASSRKARSVRYRLRSWAAYAGVAFRSSLMLLGEAFRLVTSGQVGDRGFRQRLHSSWDRIMTSVVLRDSTRLAAAHDLRDGLPVVHVNFLGYDKQAHRYGPSSAPALRALKGIDRAIASLVSEARRVDTDATIVVYSDHGQEATTPLREIAGADIEEIVRDAVKEVLPASGEGEDGASGHMKRSLAEQMGEHLVGVGATEEREEGRSVTVESGPVAHVYLADGDEQQRLEIARRIAGRAEGVAVLIRGEDGVLAACHGSSSPTSLEQLCDEHLVDHPFAAEIEAALEGIARHPDAGDLIVLASGFTSRPMTFAPERGSHGGPGPVETHAFAIAPRRLGLEQDTARMETLRRALLADRA